MAEHSNRDGSHQHANDDDYPLGVAGPGPTRTVQDRNEQRENDARQRDSDEHLDEDTKQKFRHRLYHGTMKQPMNCQMYCCERIAHSHEQS